MFIYPRVLGTEGFQSSLDLLIVDFIKTKLLSNPKIMFNTNIEPTFIESWAAYLL